LKKSLDRKKILMYLTYKAKGIQGITRFQKYVFLLQEEYKIELGYKFKPYENGPYSLELRYQDLADLISFGYIEEYKIWGWPNPRYDYRLSEFAQTYTREVIEKELDENIKNAINAIIKKWQGKNIRHLLYYVHNKWPEFKLTANLQRLRQLPEDIFSF